MKLAEAPTTPGGGKSKATSLSLPSRTPELMRTIEVLHSHVAELEGQRALFLSEKDQARRRRKRWMFGWDPEELYLF